MNFFLILAYLFFIGSTAGWVIELFFRRFISRANPQRKWINPGFCVGPYLPLYGFGLCIMYLLASWGDAMQLSGIGGRLAMLAAMAVSMTAIEYIAGITCLKGFKIRLWDYSGMWGNVQGLICPLFSLIWAAASAGYYFLIHPYILNALAWLSRNLAFSFFIGFFFGILSIDVAYSANLVSRIKKFADDNEIIVRYESLKAHIHDVQIGLKQKAHFMFPFASSKSLLENLKEAQEAWEKRIKDK